jgi:PilZ domain.
MGQSRRAIERRRTRMSASVACEGRVTRASVLNLTEEGICLYLRDDIGARAGHMVTVTTDEMGMLDGSVRWVRPPHVGVELYLCSNTRAKVESFYKRFATAARA